MQHPYLSVPFHSSICSHFNVKPKAFGTSFAGAWYLLQGGCQAPNGLCNGWCVKLKWVRPVSLCLCVSLVCVCVFMSVGVRVCFVCVCVGVCVCVCVCGCMCVCVCVWVCVCLCVGEQSEAERGRITSMTAYTEWGMTLVRARLCTLQRSHTALCGRRRNEGPHYGPWQQVGPSLTGWVDCSGFTLSMGVWGSISLKLYLSDSSKVHLEQSQRAWGYCFMFVHRLQWLICSFVWSLETELLLWWK